MPTKIQQPLQEKHLETLTQLREDLYDNKVFICMADVDYDTALKQAIEACKSS